MWSDILGRSFRMKNREYQTCVRTYMSHQYEATFYKAPIDPSDVHFVPQNSVIQIISLLTPVIILLKSSALRELDFSY